MNVPAGGWPFWPWHQPAAPRDQITAAAARVTGLPAHASLGGRR